MKFEITIDDPIKLAGITAARLAGLLLLCGCAPLAWEKAEEVERVQVVKIESDLAPKFCSELLGSYKIGCAVRMRNTDTGKVQCVVVIRPNDGDVAAHEGGHCMGYDH